MYMSSLLLSSDTRRGGWLWLKLDVGRLRASIASGPHDGRDLRAPAMFNGQRGTQF